jgi:hypothetical protein
MQLKKAIIGILVLVLALGTGVLAQDQEAKKEEQQRKKEDEAQKYMEEQKKKRDEIIDQYLDDDQKKKENEPAADPTAKYTSKVAPIQAPSKKYIWASLNFSVNRINRNNEYNTFTTLESQYIDGADFSWLGQAFILGADVGIVLKERFTWSVGGEYWMKLGESFGGTYTYSTPSGDIPVTDLKSEIQVYGFHAGLGYYVVNPPRLDQGARGPSVQIGGTAGFYLANWDLWQATQNLNLSTSLPEGTNTTFTGSAPGFTVNLSAEYPLQVWNLALAADLNYLYLNFDNVSWYNDADEEVILTHSGTEAGRVDLALSGFRAKFDIKRYFGW